MGEELAPGLNSIQYLFMNLCLKITTHSVYENFALRIRVECPNFKL